MGNVQSLAWKRVISNSVLTALTIIVVSLRLYSRRLTQAGIGFDDVFIVVATFMVTLMLITIALLLNLGFGHPRYDVPPSNASKIMKLDAAFRLSFLLCICFVKLSALFFYLRLFGNYSASLPLRTPSTPRSPNCNIPHNQVSVSNPQPSARCLFRSSSAPRCSLRLGYIVLIWVVLIFTTIGVVAELVICGGVGQICLAKRRSDLGMCLSNSGTDLLVFLLPIWPVRRLQVVRSVKIGLCLVFMLGLLTIVIAFLRFNAILKTDYAHDYYGTAVGSTYFSILEPNTAILCISLPMLRPIFRKAKSRLEKIGCLNHVSTWWSDSRVADTLKNMSSSRKTRNYSQTGSTTALSRGSGDNKDHTQPSVVPVGTDGEEDASDKDGAKQDDNEPCDHHGTVSGNLELRSRGKVRQNSIWTSFWTSDPRRSSCDDTIELRPRVDIVQTIDLEAHSISDEDMFPPARGVTITTITAGNK
ncbi:hypothetical protein F4777DRAFT_599217 [Nemania sp. FL0916]|nr:hypothetical protein F4777DRAFT_599217 [Nemania sp. FL0916]